jgi:orotate phosphoribosyltransferase
VTRLEELLLERSVERGDFVLASGAHSSWYIDCRRTTMSAEGQVLVGEAGLAAIRAAGWEASAVGGLTMGADPVAYAVAAASFRMPPILDAFSVRKEAKAHGTGRRIEGNFAPGGRVVIVEDVITSGGSALQAAAAVIEAGGVVAGVLALVDREQGGREKIEEVGHIVVAITTATRLGLK